HGRSAADLRPQAALLRRSRVPRTVRRQWVGCARRRMTRPAVKPCHDHACRFRNRGQPMTQRVYLAGPEVFLANARDIGTRKRAICERHGLVGVFPTDEEDTCDLTLPLPERGLAISRAIERAMRGCDAMIVNLTPFRGPSADVGSAYEMGFMRALGRPIFAYTNDDRPFFDRVVEFCGSTVRERPISMHEDDDGMAIERFMLRDNLMLDGG